MDIGRHTDHATLLYLKKLPCLRPKERLTDCLIEAMFKAEEILTILQSSGSSPLRSIEPRIRSVMQELDRAMRPFAH